MPVEEQVIAYTAEPTAMKFHASAADVRGIMGPIGSGKSVACAMDIYMRAAAQEPYQGVRRTRTAIIRNTYPDLLSTTLKTFQEWVPCSRVVYSAPIRAEINQDLPDGTRIEKEVLFLALDKDDDVRKLKSLELSDAWINEAGEVEKSVLDMLTGRIDRFPPKRWGGVSRPGVLMDTNPPHDKHWYHELAEEIKPHGYEFFQQPPALVPIPTNNPDEPIIYVENRGQHPNYGRAENIVNHNSGFGYYTRMVPGKTEDWIRVFIMGQYGKIMAGKPIWPEYNDDVHSVPGELEVYRGLPLIVGQDFGLTPANAFCQVSNTGQFRVIDELVSDGMGIRLFCREHLKPKLMADYPNMIITVQCDPAGAERSPESGVALVQIMQEEGIPARLATTNVFEKRRDAVSKFLSMMIHGQPAFQISAKKAPTIREGLKGGYRFKQIRGQLGISYTDSPEKNAWSHPCEAMQYAALHAVAHSDVSSKMSGCSTTRRNVAVRPSKGWT